MDWYPTSWPMLHSFCTPPDPSLQSENSCQRNGGLILDRRFYVHHTAKHRYFFSLTSSDHKYGDCHQPQVSAVGRKSRGPKRREPSLTIRYQTVSRLSYGNGQGTLTCRELIIIIIHYNNHDNIFRIHPFHGFSVIHVIYRSLKQCIKQLLSYRSILRLHIRLKNTKTLWTFHSRWELVPCSCRPTQNGAPRKLRPHSTHFYLAVLCRPSDATGHVRAVGYEQGCSFVFSCAGAWAPTTWVRKGLKSLTWEWKWVKSGEKLRN